MKTDQKVNEQRNVYPARPWSKCLLFRSFEMLTRSSLQYLSLADSKGFVFRMDEDNMSSNNSTRSEEETDSDSQDTQRST